MKLKDWIFNRVLLGMVLFFIAVGVWEFKLKPDYRPHYNLAVAHYQKQEYQQALGELDQASAIASSRVEVILLRGWTQLKLRHFTEAEYEFNRVLQYFQHDKEAVEEAQTGASFVALETGRGTMDSEALRLILEGRRGDPNVRILVAGALQREGRNLDAAVIYRELLNDKSYGEAARVALDSIFGRKGFEGDPMPTELAPVRKPSQLTTPFRAASGALWRVAGGGQQRFYVAGVNLGPAAPGYFPGAPPEEGGTYTAWLRRADEMNANVVRVYTLLPPAFYRAYRHFRDGGGKALLLQQVWVGNPAKGDLYDPAFVEETKATVRNVVDALHGRGDVPPSPGRAGGVFEHDLSAQVVGLLLGGDVSGEVIGQTNLINPGKTGYNGKYVSAPNVTPAEAWFAQMLDYLVTYETETYNWQHPVALVNSPALDPIRHPTELPSQEAISIDESRFRASGDFQGGLFAAYDVYPYQPDFMLQDPQYVRARDAEGPNPMAGYLRDLRSRISHPLVVTEYGVPDSIGIARLSPAGWNQGGLDENTQAAMLGRLARTVRDTGCAGGVVFELADEWYRTAWLTRDFSNPPDRTTLWLNELSPASRLGVMGYRTSQWRLFTGRDADWQRTTTLYQSGEGPEAATSIRRVQAAVDEGFLYLRIQVACLDCGGAGRRPDGKPDFDQASWGVALNTIPTLSGIRALPFGVRMERGANFLLLLGEPTQAKLLVAETYNPYEITGGNDPRQQKVEHRQPLSLRLAESGAFVDQIVQPNPPREGRGGVIYPGQTWNRSGLRYGNGDPEAKDYDSLAEWYADLKTKSILVRIPWGKLLVTDPSSRKVFSGFDPSGNMQTYPTPGVDVAVFALQPAAAGSAMSVVMALPAASGGRIDAPKQVTWTGWDSVRPEPYLKKAYHAMQKEFSEQTRAQVGADDGSRVAAARNAPGARGD